MVTIALLRRYGSKLEYNTGFEVNCTSFFSGKFLPWSVFWFVLRVVLGIGYAGGEKDEKEVWIAATKTKRQIRKPTYLNNYV